MDNFEFPGFSTISTVSNGRYDVVIGQVVDNNVTFTVTLTRPNRDDGAFLVHTIAVGERVVWESSQRQHRSELAHLVPTELGPVVALCLLGTIVRVVFLRSGVDDDPRMLNVTASIIGKLSAQEYLGIEPWFNAAERAKIAATERALREEREAREANERRIAAETLVAKQREDNALAHTEREERRRAFESELRKRFRVTGVTFEGRRLNGTPVLESEVERVPAGMSVILVGDLRNPARTMQEYFTVERTGTRVVRNFRTTVTPVVVTRSASGAPAAPMRDRPVASPQRVCVKQGTMVQEVDLYGSMDDIRVVRGRGLPKGTYVATPSGKEGDARIMVYRIEENALASIGMCHTI